jgi:hypothetical protein
MNYRIVLLNGRQFQTKRAMEDRTETNNGLLPHSTLHLCTHFHLVALLPVENDSVIIQGRYFNIIQLVRN